MVKKDGRKKREKARKVSPGGIDAAMARKMIERDMAAIEKIVSEREFESEDELREFLQRLVSSGELGRRMAHGPLEEAQELIYQAWETPSIKAKIKLARRALAISQDCVDAYVILAEEAARDVEEALKLYKAGLEAGERVLGTRAFAEDAGHFWGLTETRPYMRARAGLAQCLSALGKHNEAIEQYRDMLRLNPDDNQGVRYLLAACLLEMGEFASLHRLLEQYRENTAAWLYTRALLAFIRQGDSPESRQRLVGALSYNRYIPSYLLGEKPLPRRLPEYLGFGDKNEAIIYAVEFGLGWLKVKGAITWLGSVYRDRQAAQQRKSKPIDIPEVFLKAFEFEDEVQQPEKTNPVKIYSFRVSLKGHPRIWRKIEMKGSQTLHDLHQAIFKAFGRYEEHLYAFFLSNKLWDSSSEYGLPDPESNARNAKKTRIGSLGLKVNRRFLYLFDFGAQWWHSVRLLDIREEEAVGEYPRIVESKGTAPPQYPLVS